MASLLSIVKNVLNLKCFHSEQQEYVSRKIVKYGEEHQQDIILIHARPIRRQQCLCSKCRKKCPGYDHPRKEESTWRAPSWNGVPVYICYSPCRINCPEHGVLTEWIPWADGDGRFTEDFNNEVAWMALRTSKTAITEYLDINWRTVGNCIKAARDRIEPDVSVRLHGLRRICVDETSYRKGYKYITVVYDMDRNQVVWVHEKHGQSVFEQFCELLTEKERDAIEVVAGDGAKWIDTCTQTYFRNATRCIDFFHVVEWVNSALDDVRSTTAQKASSEYRRLKEEFYAAEAKEKKAHNQLLAAVESARAELAAMPKMGRPSKRKTELLAFLQEYEHGEQLQIELSTTKGPGRPRKERFSPEHQQILDDCKQRVEDIKKAKHALGHNPENRTEQQNDKMKLIEASYPDLYLAFQLKERLRLILHMKDENAAAEELDRWIRDASACGLTPMAELSTKINRHRSNILNAIRLQANSAKSESTNTTIKTLIKVARGFNRIENMIALIYLRCSDLVIPLRNRIQMTPEEAKKKRDKANQYRRQREASRRLESVSA